MTVLRKLHAFVTCSTLALMATSSVTLYAQTEDAILQQVDVSEKFSLTNGVTVTQHGTGNEAYVRQVSGNDIGRTETLQTGDQNRIRFILTGPLLGIRIEQDGSGNFFEGDIAGEDANIDIGQSGAANIIFQSLYVYSADISIVQQGDNHQVVHTGTSSGSGLHIQQQGSGMKLIIQSY